MRLHEYNDEFKQLVTLVAREKSIPESAVEKDYYIVQALSFLSRREDSNRCVFKGGTSLSKCYPNSIERFSEDIDLTYIPDDSMSDKQIERKLKSIEADMVDGAECEKITAERNNRNKSIWFWHGNRDNKIKLEIGSSVRPEPYNLRTIKSYIQEYLEIKGFNDAVKEYELYEFSINVLNIERTFVDKLMAVKRHSICDNIIPKARHIYDVVRLYNTPEVQSFIANKEELKRLIQLTKQTDSKYLEKRDIPERYNPLGAYDFESWEEELNKAKSVYEKLHEELLFTNEKQNFEKAIATFKTINNILKEISE